MCKTRHIQKRMSQRGITQKMLDLVSEYGVTIGDGDRIILNKKAILSSLKVVEELKQQLLRGAQRGGYVLVKTREGKEITTYAVNSFRR